MASCSTALAAIELHRTGGSGSPGADTITPTVDGTLVSMVIGSCANGTQNPAGFGAPSGYTILKNVPLMHRTSYVVASKAVTAGVGSTISVTIPAPGVGAVVWNAIQLLIPTTATAPVQDAYGGGGATATLASPPTPGNLLIFLSEQDWAGHGLIGPGTGWTQLFYYNEVGAEYTVAGYARCVQPGDGSSYTFSAGGAAFAQSVYLMEWAITGTGVVADFYGSPLTGPSGTNVAFTDLSTGTPTTWAWDFGDTGTSTSQNPSHVYATPGVYTVELTADDGVTPDTETKVAYITIADPEPGVVIDPLADDPVPITDDIIRWHIQRGAAAEITGGAQIGTATITLKNSTEAGADSDDKYNPDNASSPLIAYLRDGTAIHWSVNADGKLTGTDPKGMFGGRTKDWTVLPAEGKAVAPTVEVTCEDALGWYGRTPVNIAYAAGRSQREIREAILDAAAETRLDLAHEISTVPLSAGEGMALSLLEELNKADGTRHFIRPADISTDWYTYVTRNRQWRLDATSDYAVSQQDDHVTAMDGWRLSADTVTNQQRATVTPIRFTPSTYPVWTSETLPIAVTAARPFEVWVEFDDYVAGPVVNSAYSGATPTIALTPFGTTAKLTVTVASGTCTFTSLTIEGSLARRLPEQSWVEDDLTSQAPPRGVRAGSDIGGEYVGNLSTARGIAQHVVWRYATPQRRPTVTVTNWIPEMFEVQLYDLIAYTSPQLGVTDRLFEVVGITHDAAMAADSAVSHTAQFVLQECRVQDAADFPWFYLDDDPGSLLDDADKMLAY